MFWNKQPNVLVIGAGPVGLVTALTLARRNVAVKVVDEAWERGAHAYALALHPASLALLDRLGAIEPILKNCYRVRTVGFYEGAERRAQVNLAALEDDFSFVAALSQSHLEDLLGEALRAEGVLVDWNHRMARLDPGSDSVGVTIDRLDKESLGYAISSTSWTIQGSRDFEVPFVIGCDGTRSLVRRRLNVGFPEVAPAAHFAVFEFSTNYDFGHEMRVMLHRDTTNVVWPLPDGRCRFSFQLPEYDEPSDERTKNRMIVELGADRFWNLEDEDLHQLLKERAPWFDGQVEGVRWRLVVRFERRLAESFGSGRVWLAGDAGHLASPVGIHSMNVGLREGFELGNLVADVLQNKRSPADLAAYGERRSLEWKQLLGLTPRLRPGANASTWVSAHAKDVLTALPASEHDLAALAHQIGFVDTL